MGVLSPSDDDLHVLTDREALQRAVGGDPPAVCNHLIHHIIRPLLVVMEQAELSDLRVSDRSASWGQQIRNYVLQPYTKVKDARTGYETADAQGVLNGNLDPFIEAYLTHQISGSTK